MTWASCLKKIHNHVTQAAIVLSDGSILASTKDLNFSSDELLRIYSLFTDSHIKTGDCIKWDEEEYLIIYHNLSTILAKRNYSGIVAAKGKRSFVIAYHDESIDSGMSLAAVKGLAEYLISLGY